MKRAYRGLSGLEVWSLELSSEFVVIATQLVALVRLRNTVTMVVGKPRGAFRS